MLFPVHLSVLLSVVDRKSESNDSRLETIFYFPNSKIRVKFDPDYFGVWVYEINYVESLEADPFITVLKVNENSSNVLNIIVWYY